MAFTNVQVALDDLPTIDEIEFVDLEPAYPRLVCTVTLVVETLVAAIVVVLWRLIEFPPGLRDLAVFPAGAGLILATWLPIYRFKAARAMGYAVRDHDLVLKSGLFWQSEVIQPIRRIQHVELVRGPVERRLGLARLVFFSAGSGKATFTIPGLKLITAARVRRYALRTNRR